MNNEEIRKEYECELFAQFRIGDYFFVQNVGCSYLHAMEFLKQSINSKSENDIGI